MVARFPCRRDTVEPVGSTDRRAHTIPGLGQMRRRRSNQRIQQVTGGPARPSLACGSCRDPNLRSITADLPIQPNSRLDHQLPAPPAGPPAAHAPSAPPGAPCMRRSKTPSPAETLRTGSSRMCRRTQHRAARGRGLWLFVDRVLEHLPSASPGISEVPLSRRGAAPQEAEAVPGCSVVAPGARSLLAGSSTTATQTRQRLCQAGETVLDTAPFRRTQPADRHRPSDSSIHRCLAGTVWAKRLAAPHAFQTSRRPKTIYRLKRPHGMLTPGSSHDPRPAPAGAGRTTSQECP